MHHILTRIESSSSTPSQACDLFGRAFVVVSLLLVPFVPAVVLTPDQCSEPDEKKYVSCCEIFVILQSAILPDLIL